MAENEQLSTVRQRGLLPRRDEVSDSVVELMPMEVDTFASLRTYWDILLKHRWLVLTCVLVVLTIVTIYTFKTSPVYSATARLEMESETPLVQSVKDISENIPTDEAFLQTQVKILQSDSLAWETIQQLRLEENPNFNLEADSRNAQTADPRLTRDRLMKRFGKSLGVDLVRNTHVVEVSFESTDPNLAAEIANTLVSNYLEANFQKKFNATRQASAWMEKQLDELKKKVEDSQAAMVEYERKNTIVNINDKQSAAEQRLEELDRDLTNAESSRAQTQSLYDIVRSDESKAALLAENELLARLEEKQADLKSQYAEARVQYGPNFPKVVRLRDQLDEMQSIIDKERQNVIDRIRNNYFAAARRENLVAASVAQQKAEVGRLNQLLVQQNILKREFETNQQLYDNLLQRLKDATVSAGLRATNIHLVDSALAPALPVRPRKLLNISVGLMVGLLLGISLAFVLEGLEHSAIRTAEDVERLVQTTCLALIPVADSNNTPRYGLLGRGSVRAPQDGSVALTVLKDPTSPVAESYRALRSAILFSTAPQPPQTLVVTSAQPNEGKTCTALNLATVLAQNGARVLIVEGDMRNPGIGRPLGLVNRKGLSGVLTGAHGLDEALHRIEALADFWVLPAGPHPPNPAELLSSARMEELVGELRQRFEHVIIDSPPILLVTDGTILANLADGVILVAESGVTAPAALVRAHRTLAIAGARVLGVVVNKMDTRENGYHYGYYSKYYSSYYGASDTEHASAKR